jgi:hypothetical protein
MVDLVSFLTRLDDPASRRLWLLTEALRCVPLDKAVELAGVAEAFITTAPRLKTSAGSGEPATPAVPPECGLAPANASGPIATISSADKPNGLALSTEQRERLLDRLAQGASNAELAKAFPLTARHVQCIRMGAARKIAMRRQRVGSVEQWPRHHDLSKEVIRYLRQQDDVVVSQEHGDFPVNARFRLGLAELVSRAIRMRRRQGKPEFAVVNGHASLLPEHLQPPGMQFRRSTDETEIARDAPAAAATHPMLAGASSERRPNPAGVQMRSQHSQQPARSLSRRARRRQRLRQMLWRRSGH